MGAAQTETQKYLDTPEQFELLYAVQRRPPSSPMVATPWHWQSVETGVYMLCDALYWHTPRWSMESNCEVAFMSFDQYDLGLNHAGCGDEYGKVKRAPCPIS